MPSEERWLPLPGYAGLYEVSDLGHVRSLYFTPPRISRLGTDGSGYPIAVLTKEGRRMPKTVHRLVALTFHGDKRNALHNEVAHLDGDRTNARADNLKWCSKVENHSHKRRHGTHQIGDNAGHRILCSSQVSEIRLRQGTAREIAARFGVSRHAIYDIWQGKRWASVHEDIAP